MWKSIWSFFTLKKSGEKMNFGQLVRKKEIIFQTSSFDTHSDIILFYAFDKFHRFTFIVLALSLC